MPFKSLVESLREKQIQPLLHVACTAVTGVALVVSLAFLQVPFPL